MAQFVRAAAIARTGAFGFHGQIYVPPGLHGQKSDCGHGQARTGRIVGHEVARRAGHSVAVLLKVYAHCIDGQSGIITQHIDAALADDDN